LNIKVKKLHTIHKFRHALSEGVVTRWLNKQIPFSYTIKSRLKIGMCLGGILAFIIIVLEPFDTNQFESNYRYLLLSGFGVILSILYIIHSALEKWYFQIFNVAWSRKHELGSVVLYVLTSGTILFLYNYLVVNQTSYVFERHLWYYAHIVLPMSTFIVVPFLWLRNRFGEIQIPLGKNLVVIQGELNDEKLLLKKTHLIYIKAEQNYIRVCYLDEGTCLVSTLLRSTLSKSHAQAPFLIQCHKSYLVNPMKVKEITGNSQKARISLSDTLDVVPLSKSFYKKIKEELSSYHKAYRLVTTDR
tara:strand:- start:13217 stop:14122 length:906 start_codon:yes stop_codon:yes gene_type:complete